jgi:Site-specific DNA methylase
VLNSREFFLDFMAQLDLRGLTDIQRAARYYMIVKTSYAADLRTFGGKSRSLSNGTNYLSEIAERLNSVIIEHKDFEDLIKVQDRKETLFYLDPPYFKTEKYYRSGFKREDHERLKSCLKGIKGRFILSYNNDIFIKELYNDFNILEVSRRNSLLERYRKEDMEYEELIITNY